MNITEGASRTTIQPGEEKLKTFDDYLNEAESLYKKCRPLIESFVRGYKQPSQDDVEIKETDNDLAIVTKMNSMLNRDKQFEDAMSICQAKESIDSALKLGVTKRAKKLEGEIDALFKEATGPSFQYSKVAAAGGKALLINALFKRYEAVAANAARTSDRKISQSKDRLRKLAEKHSSAHEYFSDVIKECINYEKRFSIDGSSAGYIDTIRRMRATWEEEATLGLDDDLMQCIEKINQTPLCLGVCFFTDREKAPTPTDEEFVENINLLNNVIKCLHNLNEYMELLADPQTPRIAPTDSEKMLARKEAHKERLNLLAGFQTTLAYWRAMKLVKFADALGVNENVKKNIFRIEEAARKLTSAATRCYSVFEVKDKDDNRLMLSESARNALLPILWKSYEYIACECQRMTAAFPKKILSDILIQLGDALSKAGEGIFKEVDRIGLPTSVSDSEVKPFIDELFGIEHAGQEEDVDHEALEAASLHEVRDYRKTEAAHEIKTDEAEQEIASGASALGNKEEKIIASLIQELDSKEREKAQQIKVINEERRNLEKIEQKLEDKIEEVERIKQAFKEGAHIRYLAWDLESAPEKAVKLAHFAKRKALSIAARLEALEEFSISKGAVSEEEHRSQISEFAGRARKYEALEQQCRSDGKELQIEGIKAALGIEAVRKSNAAKRLLIELVDLEKDSASLIVTKCKALPHCPPAKNQFGVLEMKEGRLLYDHVVEFRVELENILEFVVHFHFRHSLEAGKSPEYYVKNMEVHDWNVQASQKQGDEEKVRSHHLEGGQKVLVALFDGWKKTLEINRGKKKETAPKTSAVPASTASVSPVGKQKKEKAKRR
jgi:hypothetical protein